MSRRPEWISYRMLVVTPVLYLFPSLKIPQSLPEEVRRDAVANMEKRHKDTNELLKSIRQSAASDRPAWQVAGIHYKVNEDGTTTDLKRRS